MNKCSKHLCATSVCNTVPFWAPGNWGRYNSICTQQRGQRGRDSTFINIVGLFKEELYRDDIGDQDVAVGPFCRKLAESFPFCLCMGSKRPQRFTELFCLTFQLSHSFFLCISFRGRIRFPLPYSTTALIGQRTVCPRVRTMMSPGAITS